MAQQEAKKEESQEVLVTVRIEIREGKWDEFIKLAAIIHRETNKEEGCISYEFYRKATDGDDKYKVELRERWRSKEDQEKHRETKHYKETYLQNVAPLAKDVKIILHYGNNPIIFDENK